MSMIGRLRERLDEIEAGPVVAAVALFLAAFIAALIWGGDSVVDVVLALGFIWLAWLAGIHSTRTDHALDDADHAHSRIEAVQNYLAGIEEPGTGKHAHPHPASSEEGLR